MSDYTPIGQGTYNTVAGSVGLASALLGGGGLGGLFGGGSQNMVNKETFDLAQKLSASESANALLSAELGSEKKMVEVYNGAITRTNNVRDELLGYYHSVDKKLDDTIAAQAVINCQLGNRIGILETKVDQLMAMTKLGILDTNIWPAT